MEQDPHAQADPAHPFGREPAKQVYKSHTDKIMKILNNPARIDPKTDITEYEKLINTPSGTPAHQAAYNKLLIKYNTTNWDLQYRILVEVLTPAILQGQESVTIGGGTSEADPRIVLTLEEVILLSSTRSPVPQTGQLLYILLERGYTHVALLKVGSCDIGEVSLAAFARHLIRSLRAPKPFGLYGHPQMPHEARADVYPHLIQILGYLPIPVSEANKTIECIMEDLREHAANPEKADLHESGDERGRPVHPQYHWRLQRGMRGIMWGTIAGLMAAPPTEENPTRAGEEANRPDTIEDPETGYWVNKGDAFLKSVELSQSEKECNNSRAANGIHSKEFSTLGFPQLYLPSLKNLSPLMTVVVCAGIVGGIIGMRVWSNGLIRVKPSSE